VNESATINRMITNVIM